MYVKCTLNISRLYCYQLSRSRKKVYVYKSVYDTWVYLGRDQTKIESTLTSIIGTTVKWKPGNTIQCNSVDEPKTKRDNRDDQLNVNGFKTMLENKNNKIYIENFM